MSENGPIRDGLFWILKQPGLDLEVAGLDPRGSPEKARFRSWGVPAIGANRLRSTSRSFIFLPALLLNAGSFHSRHQTNLKE